MQAKIYHQTSWATTSQGTSIELYKKSHSLSDFSERPILFIGGVHGDEPEGVRLAEEFLHWLKQEESANSGRLRPWVLIPCINPDGYGKNQRTNGNGVDLNRNFPCRDWSPESKAPRYYPGPSPGSEREVQALVKLIEDEKPQLIVHFHSWEPCVVYTGAPGKQAAEILATGTGYEAREDIGYPTPGSLGQYGWIEHQIPVICIEEQEHIDLNLVWPHFKPGLEILITGRNA
ncbi:M14 family murein peptide amidase A [Bdellovibrio bacteriovorus]|uniref:Putative carboxypeptidase n=1 Tax=Bdellovibrio bacteriovorus str. Tiberius TaxID=1069642 RepID=K7ZH19_BDEBC|nr:M14 family murein peptide amidase A [Bdellovibrio bacteriovorus]AFY03017.1 putative carboxypeptidase [Bdellovibrio bacteriovorus str. Tiberius]